MKRIIVCIPIVIFLCMTLCEQQLDKKQIQLMFSCRNKTSEEQDVCEENANSKWFISEKDKNDPRSICCLRWDSVYCIFGSILNKCNDTEFKLSQKYLIQFLIDLSLKTCKVYPFRSSKCESSKDEVKAPSHLVSACTSRVSNELVVCDKVPRENWNESEPIKAKCCTKWESLECRFQIINEKCSKEEQLGTYEWFIKNSVKEAIGECEDYTYKSDQCKRK